MLAVTHAITGAAIAKIFPNPAIGYFFAFLSHPVLDYIPHWDLKTRQSRHSLPKIIIYSLLDAFLGFFIGYLLFKPYLPALTIFISIFLAQLLDWLEAPYTVFKWKFPPFSLVKEFQHQIHNKLAFPEGLYTQFIVIFFLLMLSR